jgi:hypothetical protein
MIILSAYYSSGISRRAISFKNRNVGVDLNSSNNDICGLLQGCVYIVGQATAHELTE